jgi:hypothetical protein
LQWFTYGLIALHIVAAVGWLVLKREDLITPMLSGDKHKMVAQPAADDATVRTLGIALIILFSTLAIWLLA